MRASGELGAGAESTSRTSDSVHSVPGSQVGQGVFFSTVVLAVAFFARLVFCLRTDVYTDEAYYWAWSRHLSFGYFDHPPLIAWLIAILGPRLTALACGAATSFAVYLLGRSVHGDRSAAFRSAALWTALPGAFLAGTIATPDAPLFLFWALALWALQSGSWMLAGILAGGCLLSKHSGVLLLAAVLLAVLWRDMPRKGAAWFFTGALVVASPVIFWDARHDWVSLRFQLHHGLVGTGGLRSFAEFLGGQLVVAGPLLFVFAILWMARGPKQQRLVRLATALPLLAFAAASFRAHPEANWPVMAYASAAVAIAATDSRWYRGATVSALALSVLGTLYLVIPIPAFAHGSEFGRLHGWRELQDVRQPGASIVYAPNYQLASELAYYTRLPAMTVDSDRKSQFDLWPRPDVPKGSDGAWVTEEQGAMPPMELLSRYGALQGPRTIRSIWARHPVHAFQVWTLKSAR